MPGLLLLLQFLKKMAPFEYEVTVNPELDLDQYYPIPHPDDLMALPRGLPFWCVERCMILYLHVR